MMIIKSVKLENWAKDQKRVTIGRIRKEFNVNEECAQVLLQLPEECRYRWQNGDGEK